MKHTEYLVYLLCFDRLAGQGRGREYESGFFFYYFLKTFVLSNSLARENSWNWVNWKAYFARPSDNLEQIGTLSVIISFLFSG